MDKSGSRSDGDISVEAAAANGIATATAELDEHNNHSVVQATYKKLPDEDINWHNKNKTNNTSESNSNTTTTTTNTNNSTDKDKQTTEEAVVLPINQLNIDNNMGKQNGTEPEPELNDDDAAERMLKDDTKLSILPAGKDASEVKFISENGDAKIDIGAIKQSLSGMGKAELMKYANDPFWIRLRWFLFIAFWLLWAAMLAGAIAIIIFAPKCAPNSRKWWEESPIVRLEPKDIRQQDLKGLESLLKVLEKQNISAISLHSILKETTPGHTEDFKDLNQRVGLITDFQKFIKAATDSKQNVILEVDPNHSSNTHPWFLRSIKREEPYTSYYVWSNGTPSTESSRLLPPNNWVSLRGGSAWTFNEERQQFYLHQFNESQPDLNYNNPAVVNEFSGILRHWLSLGVKGFRLANTRYLVENPLLLDDAQGSTYPAESGTYESLIHTQTRDQPQNAIVLRQWRDVVLNHTNGEGLFTLSDEVGLDILQMYNMQHTKTLIDLPLSTHFLANIDPTVTAASLNQSISQMLALASEPATPAPWPSIDLNGKQASLRKRIHSEIADSLTLMTMLLPATPILKINDTTSAEEAFATLSQARRSLSFLYGNTKTHVLNGTVFVYSRHKSGNPGYLVAYNSAQHSVTVDMTTIPYLSDEVDIVVTSPNYVEKLINPKKLMSNAIPISPKSTLVVTFVPKT